MELIIKLKCICVVLENIHTPPRGLVWFQPPSLWKFQFCFIFPFKILVFEETPLPFGISNDPSWGGYAWIFPGTAHHEYQDSVSITASEDKQGLRDPCNKTSIL